MNFGLHSERNIKPEREQKIELNSERKIEPNSKTNDMEEDE